MKDCVIKAMLADPECDPTSWLGSALVSWIRINPEQLIKDEVCRKYIVAGMDASDIRVIAIGFRDYYEKTHDIQSVEKFIEQINTIKGTCGDTAWWVFERCFYTLGVGNKEQLTALAEAFCKLRGVSCEPNRSFLKFLTAEEGKLLITNWDTQWTVEKWKLLINLFEDHQLEWFINSRFTQKLDQDRGKSWPQDFQLVLEHLFQKFPTNLKIEFFKFIKEAEFKRIWSSEDTKNLAKWRHRGVDEGVDEGVKINEKLCTCGFIAKSPQGFTLHQNVCGNNVTLYTKMAIQIATLDPDNLLCPGCGKQLKSKPGYVLHQKKCTKLNLLKTSNEEY
jgi:hypothetical protein